LEWNGRGVSDIVSALRGAQVTGVHLDPDLDPDLKIKGKCRQPGWKGLFGQSGSPQSALSKLQEGDLFLFFGLFSRVGEDARGIRYVSREKSAELNALFGWLQIETIISVTDANGVRTKYSWAAGHPHLQGCYHDSKNTVYMGKEKLDIGETPEDIPGFGVFEYFSEELQLSEKGNAGSFWIMPPWLKPKGKSRSVFASHPNGTTCWTPIYDETDNVVSHRIRLGQGQEFVLECSDYPESIAWALKKIRAGFSHQTRKKGGPLARL
jgi:hypothetical protein